MALTLLVGFVIGFLVQRSRFCTVAPIRNFILTGDWRVLKGIITLFCTTYLAYSVAGFLGRVAFAIPTFSVGLVPTLLLVFVASLCLGVVSILMGGCPVRQHVMASEGNRDARGYIVGFYAGIVVFGLVTARLVDLIL